MKHNQDVEYNFCTFAIDKLLILNPSLLIFTNVLYCLLFIVISANSTNFTTNTRYHVESSVDEPHRLQQQVLVLVSLGLGVLMSSSSRSPGFLSSSTCPVPFSHIPSPHKSPGVLGSFPHCQCISRSSCRHASAENCL